MRPHDNTRVWRKSQRAAQRGTSRGRRSTHRTETQDPIPGSSWVRRHPGEWPPHLCHLYGGVR
jgi:hypothetical protein